MTHENKFNQRANEDHRNARSTRIVRFKEVCQRTGYSRSTIYLRMKEGGFPKPISLGPRLVGWPESEIDSWINDQINASRSAIGQ
jgi:prophage regulatory protein